VNEHGREARGEIAAAPLGLDYPVPEDLTTFVGRGQEIQAVRDLLVGEKKRLVTLVGIGGVGKSRLAEQLTGDPACAEAFPDGITVVRLVDVPASDDLVASTIAHQVQLLDNASESPVARLITHYQNKRALLLLDNCEQLVGEAGDGPLPRLLNILLRSVATLSVVATSQVKLGAAGENVLHVPPLRVGETDGDGSGVDEALTLLVDRAAAAVAGAPILDDEYPLARQLCRLLSGIPLAIELAAGQLDVLSLQQIVDRDQDLLPVLVNGTSEQRHHRKMSDSIARSYELLGEPEQRLFTLLSVFSGGFDLDAASTVMARFDRDLDSVEHLVGRLVRRSLLVAENLHGRKRYRMLEIIRQFAQQRLRDDPVRAGTLLQVYTDYYLDLAARACQQWYGPTESPWMHRISAELPNFRAVQERLLSDPDTAALGLDLALNATATRGFIFVGRLNESRRMLAAGLAAHPDTPSPGQVAALAMTLWLAVLQGQQELADTLLEQVEHAAGQLECFETFGPVLFARGSRLGLRAPNPAQAREALDLLSRAEKAMREHGTPGDEFMAALHVAIMTAFTGGRDAAYTESARVLAAARAADADWCISWGLWVCGLAELLHGDDAAAATRLAQQALRIQLAIRDKWGPTWALWLLALCAIKRGEHELGAQLLGGANREQGTTQTSVFGLLTFLRVQQKFESLARSELGDEPFEDHVASGHAMPPAESFARAMKPVRDQHQQTGQEIPEGLSKRELQVAGLIAQAKSNREIAETLFISHRTAEGHVRRINEKLRSRTRTEIAAWYITHVQQKIS
jgi:non-specific serine/threonine protein kinase